MLAVRVFAVPARLVAIAVSLDRPVMLVATAIHAPFPYFVDPFAEGHGLRSTRAPLARALLAVLPSGLLPLLLAAARAVADPRSIFVGIPLSYAAHAFGFSARNHDFARRLHGE
ncbi:MAG TPA: hypothetical protein VK081_10635 [Planctomycetota bacterium]|nr:hypothetical protein [Planctomycetota bacterium]